MTPTTPLSPLPRRRLTLSIRVRAILIIAFAVLCAVLISSVFHLWDISLELQSKLQEQAAATATAVREQLRQSTDALERKRDALTEPGGPLAAALSSANTSTLAVAARTQIADGTADIVQVIRSDGTIASSAHWPAAYGARDPMAAVVFSAPPTQLMFIEVSTPTGQQTAIALWAQMRAAANQRVAVVVGRFVDRAFVDALHRDSAADVVALCPRDSTTATTDVRCVVTLSERAGRIDGSAAILDSTNAPAFVAATAASERAWVMHRLDLPSHVLFVGVDGQPVRTARDALLARSIVVALTSLALALLLGSLLATRLVGPIHALARFADRLGRGELGARVPVDLARGIPELEELGGALNTMADELEHEKQRLVQAERVAAWQEIAQGLAHELKNPLTPILSAMDVLRRAHERERPDYAEILHEQTTAVIEEVHRLRELSDNFARFARMPELVREPLKLQDIIDSAALLYAGNNEIIVDKVFAADLPVVMADKKQLQVVVTNLLKNAVEAIHDAQTPADDMAPRDAHAGRVRITLQRERDDVVLSIDDNGPGIAPDIRARLFTPYLTTKGSRGTGLGLAMCQRIVVEHGGTIDVDTSALGGARFVVRVPVGVVRG